jgi:hypothetical protein
MTPDQIHDLLRAGMVAAALVAVVVAAVWGLSR